jgi:hypothetical protein
VTPENWQSDVIESSIEQEDAHEKRSVFDGADHQDFRAC